MKVKVCGITDREQYQVLESMGVDMIGFNFYAKSKRYLATPFNSFTKSTKNVGVFVNASISEIQLRINPFNLDYLQLHGNETPEFCEEVKQLGNIIKVFGIDAHFLFGETKEYEQSADYFLFDTRTSQYGGSGRKFDWQVLSNYNGDTPFFLSGGISYDNLPDILKINHPKMAGIDINSRFELSPGIKDIELINKLMSSIRNEES